MRSEIVRRAIGNASMTPVDLLLFELEQMRNRTKWIATLIIESDQEMVDLLKAQKEVDEAIIDTEAALRTLGYVAPEVEAVA